MTEPASSPIPTEAYLHGLEPPAHVLLVVPPGGARAVAAAAAREARARGALLALAGFAPTDVSDVAGALIPLPDPDAVPGPAPGAGPGGAPPGADAPGAAGGDGDTVIVVVDADPLVAALGPSAVAQAEKDLAVRHAGRKVICVCCYSPASLERLGEAYYASARVHVELVLPAGPSGATHVVVLPPP